MVLWTKNDEDDIFFEKKSFSRTFVICSGGGFGVAEFVFEGPGAPKSILGVGEGFMGGYSPHAQVNPSVGGGGIGGGTPCQARFWVLLHWSLD